MIPGDTSCGWSSARPRGPSRSPAPSSSCRWEPGRQHSNLALEIPDARPWSPASPHLYQLVAQLTSPSGAVSRIQTRFGLREVEAHGRSFWLNGERLYLDGILYQPGSATLETIRRHLIAIKDLGCNLVRVHIAGMDPRLYSLADEIGLLLWVEVPSPHRSSPRSRTLHAAELERMLLHIGAHPSVVIISLFNEDWGIEDIALSAEAQGHVAATYARLHLDEPQLLVVDNDGWQHLSRQGRITSDLLTAHVYADRIAGWRKALDALVHGELSRVTVRPLVVGDPYRYAGQSPVVVSEWGGFGFPAYGGPSSARARARRIQAYKRELRRRPIAGDVYTQAVSIEDEVNGLVDPTSGALLVPSGLLRSPPADAASTPRPPRRSGRSVKLAGEPSSAIDRPRDV